MACRERRRRRELREVNDSGGEEKRAEARLMKRNWR